MKDTPLQTADIATIQRILPHRYPFLLVDRVRDIVPGKSAVGLKAVTVNEPHFQGHFPGLPIMPGVLVIEAMAQTSAVLVGVERGVESALMIYFTTVEKAKFRRTVVPGDMLELHIEILRAGTKVGKFAGRAIVDGVLVAEAEFTAMMQSPATESEAATGAATETGAAG